MLVLLEQRHFSSSQGGSQKADQLLQPASRIASAVSSSPHKFHTKRQLVIASIKAAGGFLCEPAWALPTSKD